MNTLMKTSISRVIFISLFIISLFSFNIVNVPDSWLDIKKGDNYKKEWKSVESFEKKGLPKSALKVVESIYTKAKKENNQVQIIKALVFRIKFINSIEEDSYPDLILQVQTEIPTLDFPSKALLQSMLAELYQWYFNANQWKFYNRTNSQIVDTSDIRTWDLRTLADKSIELHKKSLSNADRLQKVKIDYFDDLLIEGDNEKELRPSLYDFLVHRAINYFTSQSLSLAFPNDEFIISNPQSFENATQFIKMECKESKRKFIKYNTISILKDLIKYRLNSDNIPAFIDADLKRLQIIYNHSSIDNKDELYISALKNLLKQYEENDYSTNVSLEIAKLYNQLASKYNPEQKESYKYQYYNKMAVEIANSAVEKFPHSSGAKLCKSLIDDIHTQLLSFVTEKTIPIDENFAVKLDYKNVNEIWQKINKIDFDEYIQLRNSTYGKKLYKKLLRNSTKLQVKQYSIPDEKDFQNHSIEIINEGLKNGIYLITISNNDNFNINNSIICWEVLKVSDISYLERSDSKGIEQIFTIDRKSGKALNNTEVTQWFRKYERNIRSYEIIKGKTYKSNSDGYFEIPNDEKSQNKNFFLEYKNGKDRLISDNDIYYRQIWERDNTKISTNFFLDRKIYRPGQTVYFKAIITKETKEGFETIPIQSKTIELKDVNFQTISKLELVSNEFGSFNGSFVIPQEVLTGRFQIKTDNGNITFNVEEYKRPKFEVEFLPFAGNYLLNKNVEIKGQAKAFSGSVISNSKVTYKVSRRSSGYRYYWLPQKEKEITYGETKSNENGIFSISFKAVPDLLYPKNDKTIFTYTIKADVTDINGETQSAEKQINIGYVNLTLDLEIDETINQTQIDSTLFALQTNNLNLEHIATKGQVTITKLKSPTQLLRSRIWQKPDKLQYSEKEWKKLYQGNEYAGELDLIKQKKGKTVFTGSFNTGNNNNINLKGIRKWETGNYIIVITAKDAFGNDISKSKTITIFNEKNKKPAYPTISFFKALNKKAEPGDNARFLIASSLKHAKVLIEIEHDGRIVKQDWLSLSNSQEIIEVPVLEKYRGNFSVHFNMVYNNRIYSHNETVIVPWTNKELYFQFSTFRDKLKPGSNEEWRITVKGKKAEQINAELLTTLYDASLDKFAKNSWSLNVFKSYYPKLNLETDNFTSVSNQLIYEYRPSYNYPTKTYDRLNWFGFRYYGAELMYISAEEVKGRGRRLSFGLMDKAQDNEEMIKATSANGIKSQDGDKKENNKIDIRTNFAETAFFYPDLKTNEKGEFVISFEVPESLTKWKFMGLAHTQNLMKGQFEKEVITQKKLMLVPNAPRFVRENDKIEFPVKISNLSKEDLSGEIKIEFFNTITNEAINSKIGIQHSSRKFKIKSNGNSIETWLINIPSDIQLISYRVIAEAGSFSDGEENIIPALTNRVLLTESLPLWIKGKGTKKFEFKKLKTTTSSTLKNYKYTLEFTSNPAWYAVQALPYIMDNQGDCSEQIFSRYYANALASHVANSNPKIKKIFDAWKASSNKETLLSNLEKNKELKQILLEETPWVLDAKNETEQKRRIALLFDLNKMANELDMAIYKLQKMQTESGGWPWYTGMKESRYITQHIISGLGHLKKLGAIDIQKKPKLYQAIYKAIAFMDKEVYRDYKNLKRSSQNMNKWIPSQIDIQYLYTRSFFNNIPVQEQYKEAFDYIKTQAETYWTKENKYLQAMIALAFYRFGDNFLPKDIIKSIKEFSIMSDEMGMYWKSNNSYYWYQAPIERQALFIELFTELNEKEAVIDEMKVWLLKQKQTQAWKTTKATTEAVYALLLSGSDWLADNSMVDIKIAGKKVNIDKDGEKPEAGTSYFTTSWNANEIKKEMGDFEITKNTKGIAWGSVYWQYFENLDKITQSDNTLQLNKTLFKVENTPSGEKLKEINETYKLQTGDRVRVRIEIQTDRLMEYVHLKDMRASGFEPTQVISSYKYQDGLGYYQSTGDVSTNFFFDHISQGKYILEYTLVVSHKGEFSNGISTIQCMYAPEFTSHSEGIKVVVE